MLKTIIFLLIHAVIGGYAINTVWQRDTYQTQYDTHQRLTHRRRHKANRKIRKLQNALDYVRRQRSLARIYGTDTA